ncbi:TraI domain-containing protein [Paraburkholderia sp. J8-2]|uniref:TraI domain-containing protein n=1 Tax=Paraburkholderia sp. J8-2 TaxID=2805440 RepID=UPI002AB7E94E|nr:TraI domain-containing protein [Paraburkholderia sp. J8-2]
MELTVKQPQDLLRAVDERTGLLARIRSASEMNPGAFDKFWLPKILAVADYVQEVPYEQGCYAEHGGMLRYALMSAYYALQVASGRFFTGSHGAEKRRTLVPQYRFAVFVATLAGIPATLHARLIIRAAAKTWTPFHAFPAIGQWARQQDATGRYSVELRQTQLKISASNAVAWSADLMGIGTWQEFDEEVALVAHDAIYQIEPKTGEATVITCVRTATRIAREFELKHMNGQYVAKEVPEGITPALIEEAGAAIQASQAVANPPSPPATEKSAQKQAEERPQPKPEAPSEVKPHAGGPSAATRPSPTPSAPSAEAPATPAVSVTIKDSEQAALAAIGIHAPEPEPAPSVPAAPKLPDIVLEIFQTICKRADHEEAKKSWQIVEQGISVPNGTFSRLGLPTASVMNILREHGLIVETPRNRTHVILDMRTHSLLFG